MSGIVNQLLGNFFGGDKQGQPDAIVGMLRQVLTSEGGISALVSKFEAAGLGSEAKSWVGTGANQPITPEHIDQVFSAEKLQTWAAAAGTTPDKLRTVLAEALPQAVDHATPDGQVPSAGGMPDLSGLLSRFAGGQHQ